MVSVSKRRGKQHLRRGQRVSLAGVTCVECGVTPEEEGVYVVAVMGGDYLMSDGSTVLAKDQTPAQRFG
jgi:hypothetical protein